MRLAPGTQLGHYEITALIGAGGMGEVYRARDTKLDRTVAIKILLEMGSADPQTRDRFEREARLVASLDHPNICSLHDTGRLRPRSPGGVEDGAEIDFLVMQFLEGETLADRLQKGPLPLAEAMTLAGQIAGALDRAHSHGIVHRDLKPGNVMLTKSGARLLDFGLARLDVTSAGAVIDTATRQVLTEAGAVMGTLPYMAPEQVSGQPLDARADIWAFGCVVYEMLGGRRPFDGDSQAALIGAIMQSTPPPLSQVVPGVPRAVEEVIAGALVKDREERWQNIRDVQRALAVTASAPGPTLVASARSGSRAWPFVAVLVLAAGVVGLTALLVQNRTRVEPLLVRFDVRPGNTGRISNFTDTHPYVAVSPDGTQVAFVVIGDEGNDIWVKRLDGALPEKVLDTKGAQAPFWSPDGQSIAFFGGGKLKRKAISGGAVQILCDVLTGAGVQGAWSPRGQIIYAEWSTRRLLKVPENGGTPVPVRTQENPFGWPELLPDGVHYLSATLDLPTSTVRSEVGSLDSDAIIPVAGVESRMQYVAGHLLFWREGRVLAQPFDLTTFQLTGQPVPIADQVHAFALTGSATFSVSPTTLVYQSGLTENRLVWTNRQGLELGTVGPAAEYTDVRLSLDGSSAASNVRDAKLGTTDIFIHELARDVTRRLTSDRGVENWPIWSPDGKTIVYSADRNGPPHLYARAADGTGVERQIAPPSIGPQNTGSMTPDARSVVYPQQNLGTSSDIMIVPFDGSAPPTPLVQTPQAEGAPSVSPDGKWLGFSRQAQLFVQGFPDGHGLRQISRDGGAGIRWRRDTKELYFVRGDQMMAVDLNVVGDHLEPGNPHILFTRATGLGAYDVSADGQKFLIIARDVDAERGTLSVVMNWTHLLKPK